MITKEDYLKAKTVIQKYEDQIIKDKNSRFQKSLEDKYKKCEETGGHEYREDTYKWGSPTRMSCIFCGKTID